MNDALVVMHPRRIPECVAAFAELDIDKLLMDGFTEWEIMQEAFPAVLEHDYDWLWLASDDLVVRPQALAAVRALRDDSGAPVVTGYSQFAHDDWRVNLTKAPLSATHPGDNPYEFFQFHEVYGNPEPAVRSWFTGMALTGMSREDWRRFPFKVDFDPGWASDFNLSLRLQRADVPIVAARDGFCYHWRHHRLYGADERDAKVQLGAKKLVLA